MNSLILSTQLLPKIATPIQPPHSAPTSSIPAKSFATTFNTTGSPRFLRIDIPRRNKVTHEGKPKADKIRQHIQKTCKLSGPFSTECFDGRNEHIMLYLAEDIIQALASSYH